MWRSQQGRAFPKDLLAGVAGQTSETRIHVIDHSIRVGDHHSAWTLLYRSGKSKQFFLGPFSGCQIVNDGDKQPFLTQHCFTNG